MFGRLFATDCLRARAGLTAIAPTRGLSYKGSEVMNIDTKTYVVGLLESYQKRSKQIELLHYELSHPAHVSANEVIGALALAHNDGGGHPGSHASDRTLYIALNYQDRANQMNHDASGEAIERLVALEQEQERLKYYVSLLTERRARVIKLTYFEGYTQEDVAAKMDVAKRTVQMLKAQAIDDLAAMYDYTPELR